MIPELTARQAELETLCQRFAVRRLEVFGSAVAGGFHPDRSDLDFLVEFQNVGPGYADRYFGLLESLEGLYGCHVDLIVNSAIRNPFFRKSVERSKAVLYAA